MAGRIGTWHLLLSLSAAIMLSGCGTDLREALKSRRQIEEQTPFVPVPASHSWINAPGTVLVLQRGLRGESEQHIGLLNDTTLPGENLIVIRAATEGANPGRFRFERFLHLVGGAPAPFTDISGDELQQGRDEIGTYFWAERPMGAGVVCVFALRRVTEGQRLLPMNAASMDMMLRNCARGGADKALQPLLDDSISTAPVSGTSAGSSLMMSPLAAPGMR